jgi:hypothetical protein
LPIRVISQRDVAQFWQFLTELDAEVLGEGRRASDAYYPGVEEVTDDRRL